MEEGTTEGADPTDTEGAGGKMDISDFYAPKHWAYAAKGAADIGAKMTWAPFVRKGLENVSSTIDREYIQKKDLRDAEYSEMLSGVPIVGSFLRGVQGVRKLEDLYDRTGNVPAYPGDGSSGAGGIGSAAAGLSKIADGRNDLYQYYAGEPDQYTPSMYG